MAVKFEQAEAEIREAEKELQEAIASGASARRCIDLGQRVRRLRREYRKARQYYAAAIKQREDKPDKEYQATRGETIRHLRRKVNA